MTGPGTTGDGVVGVLAGSTATVVGVRETGMSCMDALDDSVTTMEGIMGDTSVPETATECVGVGATWLLGKPKQSCPML